MKRADEKQVKRAIAVGRAGKLDEALRILDNLIGKTTDHLIKIELLHYQMMWLLEAEAVPQAREKFNEMQMQMALVDGAEMPKSAVSSALTVPDDTDRNDVAAYLAVIARFAEAKLLIKERDEASALDVLDGPLPEATIFAQIPRAARGNGDASGNASRKCWALARGRGISGASYPAEGA